MGDKELMLAIIKAVTDAAGSATAPDFKAMSGDLLAQLQERAKTMGADGTGDAGPPSDAAAKAAKAAADEKQTPGGAAPMAAGAGVSLADVQRLLREERQKEALIASAKDRPGMSETFATLLASRSLAEARELVGALPPAPTAPPVKGAPLVAGAAAVTGATSDDAPTAEEAHDIKLLDRAFGIAPERLQASREAAAKGEAGVISVARLEKVRLEQKKA